MPPSKSATYSRHAAWEVLRSANTTPLRGVDAAAARHGLEPRERAFLRRLVGVEVRRRATLRAVVAAFTRGKPNADLSAHLRIGAAQLLLMGDVPDHAAVSETVRATSDTLGLSKGRLVNGVLRNIARARRDGHCGDPRRDVPEGHAHVTRDVFRDPEQHPLLWAEDALSIPATLLKRWQRRMEPERALALARLFAYEPDVSLRVVSGTREALEAELSLADIPTRPGAHPLVLRAPSASTARIVDLAAFTEGRATIQGESALRAAELLDARSGETVLDLCAAPGGKTAVLAASGARVVATDRDPRRLARVPSGLERLGVKGVSLVACEGTQGLTDGARFDAVLVDAPCSNTGVLGARPGARWRYGPKNQAALVELQAALLRAAAGHVRPGGRLVWSTCSLEAEENTKQVAALVDEGGFTLEREQDALPSGPDDAPGPVDGGYSALLVRRG